MDAQALDLTFTIPGLPRILPHRRVEARATPAPAGPAPEPGAATGTHPWLQVYTTASIAAGLGALVWTTLQVPVRPAIDTGLTGTALAGPDGGLLLWIALGFMGSLRVLPIPGSSGVWTFHLPFVAAAMVLGGPTAGAWVGLLSSLERRELESQPWYGAAANHAVLAFAAVAGGLTVEVLRGALASGGADPGTVGLLSTAAGTVALAVIANGLAAGTIMLRERLSVRELIDIALRSLGRMTVAEVALAWIFVVAYTAVGWWAPLVAAIGVLLIWPEQGEVDFLDPLTKLMRLRPFEHALDSVLARSRRGLAAGGLLLSLDLDGFGAINRDIGHAAADEVLAEIGSRLRAAVRASDLVGRLGGDEFAIFFAGVVDVVTARRLAEKIAVAIRKPVVTDYGVLKVGVSIGGVVVPPSAEVPRRSVLMHWADTTMQAAKRAHKADPSAVEIAFHAFGLGVADAPAEDRGEAPADIRIRPHRVVAAIAAVAALILSLATLLARMPHLGI